MKHLFTFPFSPAYFAVTLQSHVLQLFTDLEKKKEKKVKRELLACSKL